MRNRVVRSGTTESGVDLGYRLRDQGYFLGSRAGPVSVSLRYVSFWFLRDFCFLVFDDSGKVG